MTLKDDFLVFSSPHPDPAGNGKKHWAGAQRPKAETGEKNVQNDLTSTADKKRPVNCVFTITEPLDSPTYHPKPTNCAYTNQGGKNLNLKLRKQAHKLGLIPGSPQWRAYVLGTVAAMKKRKRGKSFRECVTPGNYCQNGTNPLFLSLPENEGKKCSIRST